MTRVPAPQALALRRVVLVALCLAATLGAHVTAAGGVSVRPAAPLAWVGLLALVALAGPRRRWRPRGALRTVGLAAAVQALAHAAMTAAPWAVGLAPHHAGHAAAGLPQIVPHAVAAVLIALLVARLERWLMRAAEVARRVRRWFAPVPAPSRPRRPAPPARLLPAAARALAARWVRGPPVLRTT